MLVDDPVGLEGVAKSAEVRTKAFGPSVLIGSGSFVICAALTFPRHGSIEVASAMCLLEWVRTVCGLMPAKLLFGSESKSPGIRPTRGCTASTESDAIGNVEARDAPDPARRRACGSALTHADKLVRLTTVTNKVLTNLTTPPALAYDPVDRSLVPQWR